MHLRTTPHSALPGRALPAAPVVLSLALAAALLLPTAAAATNGMYLIGYGPETVGRGGANLAISDRTLAINFNPAGISQLQGNHFSASLSVLAPSLELGDMEALCAEALRQRVREAAAAESETGPPEDGRR